MGAWTEPTPSGGLRVVNPTRCPNGHSLAGNVTNGSDVTKTWHRCETCHAVINRAHDERVEWVSHGHLAARPIV